MARNHGGPLRHVAECPGVGLIARTALATKKQVRVTLFPIYLVLFFLPHSSSVVRPLILLSASATRRRKKGTFVVSEECSGNRLSHHSLTRCSEWLRLFGPVPILGGGVKNSARSSTPASSRLQQ